MFPILDCEVAKLTGEDIRELEDTAQALTLEAAESADIEGIGTDAHDVHSLRGIAASAIERLVELIKANRRWSMISVH